MNGEHSPTRHPPTERILIEGVGGIGGVVAGRLIQAGYAPVLVTANAQITAAIRSAGLRVTMPESSFSVPPAQCVVYTSLNDLPPGETFDAAYLLMKATSVVQAAQETLPLLKPDGYMVTFQNGIVEDAVAAVVGAARVVSGIIGWGGTMHAPGIYEKTTPGQTHLGELDGSSTPRLRALAAAVQHAAPVVLTQNIRGALWGKLGINCTVTTLGALTGDTLGVMLRDARLRRLFLRAYAEVVETAEAQGIRLERIAANPKLLYLPPGAGAAQAFIKDLLVRLVARRYGGMKSSMLQSLERGRKTEIDFLNGYVVACAQRAGRNAPVNAALVQLVKEIEAGTRTISRANTDVLLRAVNL